MSEVEYTLNHNIDGWPICKNGEPIWGNKAMLAELQQRQARVQELEAINLGLTKTLVEMEAENAELLEAVARCRYQASFIIGSPESLRERMRKIREIANEALAGDEGEA